MAKSVLVDLPVLTAKSPLFGPFCMTKVGVHDNGEARIGRLRCTAYHLSECAIGAIAPVAVPKGCLGPMNQTGDLAGRGASIRLIKAGLVIELDDIVRGARRERVSAHQRHTRCGRDQFFSGFRRGVTDPDVSVPPLGRPVGTEMARIRVAGTSVPQSVIGAGRLWSEQAGSSESTPETDG
jgi:hypothetical protein